MLLPLNHLQHVNDFHSGFKRWLMPFNSVTKGTYITRTTIRNRFIELT